MPSAGEKKQYLGALLSATTAHCQLTAAVCELQDDIFPGFVVRSREHAAHVHVDARRRRVAARTSGKKSVTGLHT